MRDAYVDNTYADLISPMFLCKYFWPRKIGQVDIPYIAEKGYQQRGEWNLTSYQALILYLQLKLTFRLE